VRRQLLHRQNLALHLVQRSHDAHAAAAAAADNVALLQQPRLGEALDGLRTSREERRKVAAAHARQQQRAARAENRGGRTTSAPVISLRASTTSPYAPAPRWRIKVY
jgi:Tfp pilus assembly protein PilN